MSEVAGNGQPEPGKPDGLVEALRSDRGFKEIQRLLQAESAIGEHITALTEAAVTARAPGAPPTVDLRALIPAWESLINLADSSIKNLKALGVKEPPLDFGAITQSDVVPLNKLAYLIDQETEYTIYPICPRGALTMVQGMPKGGKSTFSLWLALCAAIGQWPSGVFRVDKPLKVLFIEYEDRPILVVKRASRYLAGAGMEPKILPDNLYLCDNPTLWLDTQKYEDALKAEIIDERYDLVVLDTLSYVHRAESENDAAEMKVLTASLKRIVAQTDCSLIFIHHTGKGSKDKAVSEAARGSSVIPACADVILHWGDRGDTDTTPVSVTSKYDDGFRCNVEYVRHEGGAVSWKVELDGAKKARGQEATEEAFGTICEALVTAKDGIRFGQLKALLTESGCSDGGAKNHIRKLVEGRRLTRKTDEKGVVWYVLGGAREA